MLLYYHYCIFQVPFNVRRNVRIVGRFGHSDLGTALVATLPYALVVDNV